MTKRTRSESPFRFLGEFVDEAEIPANASYHRGKAVRLEGVTTYVDVASHNAGGNEFTVLLEQGAIVTVSGSSLKLVEPSHPGGVAHYAILQRVAGDEVIVGLFPVSAVRGAFRGRVQAGLTG